MRTIVTSPIVHPEQNPTTSFLESLGLRFKIVAFGKPNLHMQENVKIVSKRGNFFAKNFLFYFSLFQERKNFDTIMCMHALAAAVPSIIFSKMFRQKMIINFSSDEIYERYLYIYKNNLSLADFYKQNKEIELPTYLQVLKLVQQVCLRASSAIVVPSQYFKDLIVKEYNLDAKKVFVIYPFFNQDKQIKLPFNSQKNIFNFLTFVSLSENIVDRLEKIICMLSKLRNKYPEIHFDIFGDGNGKEKLQIFLNKNNFHNLVTVHGRVSQSEIVHSKRHSGFFFLLNPSPRNIFHILENFSDKCITLALKNQLSQEYIQHQKDGILFDWDNLSLLEFEIEDLFNNPNQFDILCENGYKNIGAKHNLENYFNQLETISKQI